MNYGWKAIEDKGYDELADEYLSFVFLWHFQSKHLPRTSFSFPAPLHIKDKVQRNQGNTVFVNRLERKPASARKC